MVLLCGKSYNTQLNKTRGAVHRRTAQNANVTTTVGLSLTRACIVFRFYFFSLARDSERRTNVPDNIYVYLYYFVKNHRTNTRQNPFIRVTLVVESRIQFLTARITRLVDSRRRAAYSTLCTSAHILYLCVQK